MPFMIVLAGDYNGLGAEPSSNSLELAIFIMIFEFLSLIVVSNFIVLIFNVTYNKRNKGLTAKYESKSFIILCIVILLILIITQNPYYLFSQDNIEDASNIVIICRNLLRALITIFIFIYSNNKINKNITILIITLFLFLLVYSTYIGVGRWDSLILGVIGLRISTTIFYKYKKIILLIMIPLITFIMVSVSIFKFQNTSVIDSDTLAIMSKQLSNQFQMYFSGPRNIALAIEMKNYWNYDFDINFIINDFLGSMPIFSKYANQDIRFNYLFNLYIYRGEIISQIIPLSGIGYLVFGFFGTPIIYVFFNSIVIILDRFYYFNKNIMGTYIFEYMIMFTSLCAGFNIQIIANKYYAFFIPLVIIYVLSKNIKLNKYNIKNKWRV